MGWLSAGSEPAGGLPLTDHARKAMLDLLLFDGMGMDEAGHLALLRRIRYARDLDALWYLRPELVCALAAQLGERVARERVNRLALYFGTRATPCRSNTLMGR